MTNESIFKLDRAFIKRLCRRLSKPNKFGFKFEQTEIPTIDQMQEIISTTMWASMQREEGRLSRFRIAFGEPFILDHLALIFEVHKRWSVEELRKLAPAVVQLEGHIGVWPIGPNGDLKIWGLLTNSMLQLTVEVIDPGRITVSTFPNSKIAEITGERAGFVSPDWNSNALELFSPPNSDIEPTTLSIAMSYLHVHSTQEILRQMRLLGHGGALVFVPNGNRWERSVEPIVYACSQKLNKIERVRAAFNGEVSRIAPDGSSFDVEKTKSCLELFSERYKPWVDDAARSIAYLTAVDGATVLNQSFEVMGFGVKLKTPQRVSKTETVTTISRLEGDSTSNQVPVDEEFRGTRHSSAARFVLKNPGSLALVVSQDGGITGLVNRRSQGANSTSEVLAYRGLELLL